MSRPPYGPLAVYSGALLLACGASFFLLCSSCDGRRPSGALDFDPARSNPAGDAATVASPRPMAPGRGEVGRTEGDLATDLLTTEGDGWAAALTRLSALDAGRQSAALSLLLEQGEDGLWAALLAADELSLASRGALELSLRRLVEAGLERGKADYDVAELAFRLLARLEPARHLTLSRTLAADPEAPPSLLAGVLVTLEDLTEADSQEVVARLAKNQSLTVGGPVQREEIARGALCELVRRGAEARVRDQLLAGGESPGRLWAAQALHAEGRLLGPTGLTLEESARLAQHLIGELGSSALGSARDDDRLELLGALPFTSRFDAVLAGLSQGAVHEGAVDSLVDLAARDVPPTAGPELGALLLDRARAADPATRERLVRVLLAVPERATLPWQRAEAEGLLARVR